MAGVIVRRWLTLVVGSYMAFYFTESQVPELTALTKTQRRTVSRGAADMVHKEKPSFVLVAGSPGLGAMIGFFVISGLLHLLLSGEHRLVAAILGGAVGIVIGSYVGAHLLFVFMRPYYRCYIEAHRDEISTTA